MDSTRRPCFTADDSGLADTEAGFSGNYHHHRPLYYCSASHTRISPRSLSLSNSPHFLEACFFCNKSLSHDNDIFMYRGDTPFCSEECRSEQIEIDEANEKKWNLSASMKALRKNQKKSNSTSPNKAQDHPFRTSTLAAA